MIRQSNFSECGHAFGKIPAALPFVLLLLGWGPATDASAFGQEAPKDTPTGVELAGRYHQNKQYPEMIAVLDATWRDDLESILKESLRVGNYYADAKQGDALIRRIEQLDDTALLERYGDRLRYFAMVFAHRSDQADVAIRTYAAVMKVAPIPFRCELAREYGELLQRQARLPEAYEVYKLGFFPAASNANGDTYTVPNLLAATTSQTGDVLSPIVALADLAGNMQASDRLRADTREAIQKMPAWKPGGDLLLAMLSRREGNEQPLADMGSRCIDDPQYRAAREKLMGVLRHELSKCDDIEPLGTARSLWQELAESSDDYQVDSALHQLALIELKTGNSEQARRLWLKIVDRLDDAKPPIEQGIRSRTFVAEQLQAHGFPVDALGLVRQILEADRGGFSERSYALYLIEQTENKLVDVLRDARADKFKFAKAKEDQIQTILLGLLVGETARKNAESGTGLRVGTIVVVAESILALAKSSGQLARLRQQWDAHPMADSLNLLSLRAEAAMTNGDSGAAEKLLARISDIERSSGRTAPLWSPACLFHGLDQKFKAGFRDDLCGSELDGKVFRMMPPKLEQHVQTGSDGLRLLAPPELKALGFAFMPPLRGDFEVTASYALPHATKLGSPRRRSGGGACMRVWSFDGKRQLAGFFGVNGLQADQGGCYTMNRGHIENGKHDIRGETTRTSARSGRLRVVRKGATLYFLAADEDSPEFRRLHQIPFTTDNTAGIRLGVHPVDPTAGMEVRWKNLVIRAEGIVGIGGEQVAAMSGDVQFPEPAQSIQEASERRRWVWWLVVVFVVSLSTTGLWWMARAKRARSD